MLLYCCPFKKYVFEHLWIKKNQRKKLSKNYETHHQFNWDYWVYMHLKNWLNTLAVKKKIQPTTKRLFFMYSLSTKYLKIKKNLCKLYTSFKFLKTILIIFFGLNTLAVKKPLNYKVHSLLYILRHRLYHSFNL